MFSQIGTTRRCYAPARGVRTVGPLDGNRGHFPLFLHCRTFVDHQHPRGCQVTALRARQGSCPRAPTMRLDARCPILATSSSVAKAKKFQSRLLARPTDARTTRMARFRHIKNPTPRGKYCSCHCHSLRAPQICVIVTLLTASSSYVSSPSIIRPEEANPSSPRHKPKLKGSVVYWACLLFVVPADAGREMDTPPFVVLTSNRSRRSN